MQTTDAEKNLMSDGKGLVKHGPLWQIQIMTKKYLWCYGYRHGACVSYYVEYFQNDVTSI